jgi:hypothetical protein
MTACPRCGTPPPPGAAHCPACGAPLASSAGTKPGTGKGLQQTVLGVAFSPFAPQPPAPAPVAPPTPAPSTPLPAAQPRLQHTVLGVAPSPFAQPVRPAPADLAAPAPAQQPWGPAPQAPAPEPVARPVAARPMPVGEPKKTMLGVAMPGIAPLAPGVAKDEDPVYAPLPRYEPEPYAPAPQARQRVPQTGPRPSHSHTPAIVAIGGGVLLLVGATVFALLWRSPAPLSAEPRVDATGRDALHITCASCPDGTELSSDGARATVKDHAADLTLASSLRVGNNRYTVVVKRPLGGRDENAELAIPIGYRIRPDLAPLDSDRPVLRIAVESTASTPLKIADTPITLDALGRAVFDVDVTKECSGPSDDAVVLDKSIPYEAGGGDRAERSTVSVRIPIPVLHLDAPNLHAVVQTDTVLLAGRTTRGARVLVGGQPLPTAADGTFAARVPVAPGTSDVVVRASATGHASRVAHLEVQRVARLADAATEFATKAKLTFAEAFANPEGGVGQPIVLDGKVVEARAQSHSTVALLDIGKACTSPPCLARVAFAGDETITRDEALRVLGHVVRPARRAASDTKQPVLDVAADFFLRGK